MSPSGVLLLWAWHIYIHVGVQDQTLCSVQKDFVGDISLPLLSPTESCWSTGGVQCLLMTNMLTKLSFPDHSPLLLTTHSFRKQRSWGLEYSMVLTIAYTCGWGQAAWYENENTWTSLTCLRGENLSVPDWFYVSVLDLSLLSTLMTLKCFS